MAINTAVSGSVAGDLVSGLSHRVTRFEPQVARWIEKASAAGEE